MCESYYLYGADESTKQWSSLVEGDEQPDRPNKPHVWKVTMHV